MSSVSEMNTKCPVCHGNFAHTDLNCRTHERLISCERCGFYYETKVVEHNGVGFWEMTDSRPISKDGTFVASADGDPEGQGKKWNAVEFRTVPSFTAIPEVFGAENADDEKSQRCCLCIIDSVCVFSPEIANEPAAPWRRRLESMSDEQPVAFHDQICKGESTE